MDFNSWRDFGDSGPKRISLSLLNDYCRFSGIVLDYKDLSIIRVLDDLYLEWYYKLRKDG